MFAVIVDIKVKAEFTEQFKETVIRQGENSIAKEDGCLGFDILQNPDDPSSFTLYETYTDAATFHDIHRRTPHFQAYAQATEPWVESKAVRALNLVWPQV